MENQTYQTPQPQYNDQPQIQLPNATAVLVLGIISIITCCCYGGGLILGIIALVLASKDMKRFNAQPQMYTVSSYNNLKAGRICAIIAVIFSLLYIVCMIAFISMFGLAVMQDPQALQEALKNMQ